MNEQWSLIVVEDEESLTKEAAGQVRDQLRVKPDSVLALPTGAILLLASGPDKAHILACSLDGPVSTDIPASFLVEHPRLTVVADRHAAAATSIARD